MKVLVIGGGGREHAIVHTLKKSPKVDHIWCAPGNGGIAAEAECVAIKATDIDGMVAFAKENKPDLVMVAPDDPLALGMVDALEAAGIRAFGPRKNAAIIEGSKSFAKDLMQKYNIPTAGYAVFENSADAIEYIRKNGAPINDRIMLTGTSPGGRMTLPTVSHMLTSEKPSSAEAGKRYL